MSTPTLINLPPPPSEPLTPSDVGPGTPNSGTTSLSAVSTTAIKDGHQGNRHPHSRHVHRHSGASESSTTTLDAERADRISRLAGLERVATARPSSLAPSMNPQGATAGAGFTHPPAGYFDPGHFQLLKERSTVGSASATASVGGRTTWASGSDIFDDRMGDDDVSSTTGLSDEGNSSIVGFGEGANSTISGPISTAHARAIAAGSRHSSGVGGGNNSPSTNRSFPVPPHSQQNIGSDGGLDPSSPSPAGSITPEPRMVDGMTYDPDIVDTTVRTPVSVDLTNDEPDPFPRTDDTRPSTE
ncbi:hypothetical protein AJ80_07525 [Polytolypa hystricis UAMH7299]|uniref:Uncharacterized protein n=1 Tax=Polytolypa hystricis (strain UAMH7299) TaxID=1447883 RepID=A0A2B7XPB4_POLH7|nr:hypothetical protein AJ80_07525 [Polytolypa hystricis UAMH7299]